MLRLKNIRKSYTTAGFTQNALDGVSLAFRDNEFAAILGPSGSGKTTMLNIIGGLDQYDDGDLEIDGISTSSYKASDWDTYRNNRIGFVFQSYNLIPHQTVLANVELALTLSGVSKSERRKKAQEALTEVGLEDHMRKKPGQLSGGQMQRVAIARALINDPEILLADEPTGALDSTTSLHVMELLTKIAKNRLVIMVTHNNELAEQYATRIVSLADGRVKSDTNPLDYNAEQLRKGRQTRKASMSFLTAIMLSFSNLMTKKGRTLTTAFAGSIGIIGIATILAFSNGINLYIRNIEEETLSIYPLVIQDQGFDLSAFFVGDDGGTGPAGHGGGPAERPPDTVREMNIMETVFAHANNNDLGALKAYFVENEEILNQHVNTIHYMFDITPQIFLSDTSDGPQRVHPDEIFADLMGGGGGGMPAPDGGLGFMPTMNVFSELPNDDSLFIDQYEILTGTWPQRYDEAVLVVSSTSRITDFALFSLGIRERSEMRAMLESVMGGTDMEVEITPSDGDFTYERLMAVSFRVVNPAEAFQYDEIFNVWVDRSGDTAFMENLVESSMELNIVGIVRPKQDATMTVLAAGVNYSPALIYHLMAEADRMPIVNYQLANPYVNVLTGNTFEHEAENPETEFDFSRIISIDEDVFAEAMGFDDALGAFDISELDFNFDNIDMSALNFGDMDFGDFDLGNLLGDMGGAGGPGGMMGGGPGGGFDMGDMMGGGPGGGMGGIAMPPLDLSQIDMTGLATAIAGVIEIDQQDFISVLQPIMVRFMMAFMQENPELFFPAPDPDILIPALLTAFGEYISSPEVVAEIMAGLQIDVAALQAQINVIIQNFIGEMIASIMAPIIASIIDQIMGMIGMAMNLMMAEMQAQIETAITYAMESMITTISTEMQSAMEEIFGQIEENITEAFEGFSEQMEESMEGFDAEALTDAFQIEIGEEEILDLMMAMMNPRTTSFEQNLRRLGWADPNVPTQILIYPRSFDDKQEVLDILENYNLRMEALGYYELIVHFTDFVGMMMATITEIIDIVSYALIAFVSVALIVSSIMIGVITFISVLERKKEIGILRAVGASKGNIRLVFNAETLIIGFVAGVIGVLATLLISIVANMIIAEQLDIQNLVVMPVGIPFVLVAISMFLTYVAGLLPASAAARKAPVEALRSE
ncbi:MAG: ABC transporter ATP-binding protein/permease [Oscillospiraceae bacterium]|nr:ABC transporter ATP-binding protein/permease [Oscillospiraceae bacterium]